MKLMVFGAGALGSVVAARLAEVHSVSLVGRREHVEAIRSRGLRITGHTELVQTRLEAVTDAADVAAPPVAAEVPDPPDAAEVAAPPDAVLLTVKAYDTAAALEALAPLAGSALFVSLQNGLGNEEILATRCARVLGAVINQGATMLAPGEVYHAGSGSIAIGPFSGTDAADAEAIAAVLAEAGFPARAVPDIRARIWEKAILNAAVNPLSALLRKRTGELIESEALRGAMRQVVDESVAIAAACGVELSADAVFATIEEVARATRDNKSSMYQDVEKGRRTEIEAINGALVARAHEHGLACAANELLLQMIRAVSSP